MIPANLRNLLLNTLSRYHYQVTNANDGGLGACIDDLAIQQLAVVAPHCHLQNILITSTSRERNLERSAHLRLRRTRALPVTAAGPIGCFPLATFRHVNGTPGRRDPMMSSFQPVGGQKRKERATHESASIYTV